MLIYIEYRSRRPNVDLELFHKIVGRRSGTWSDANPEDLALFNVGRTWRIGPEPEYLIAYYTRNKGLGRLDDWERIFESGEVAQLEAQTRSVCRIDTAGCYVPLLEPAASEGGPYYAEFFEPTGSREEVAALFEDRRKRYGDFTLNLVCDRIGKLGPEPPGLAFWSVPSYASLETIAAELEGASDPIRLVAAGLYHDVGKETL